MALKARKSNDLDKLFEDLGVLDFGDGIDVPKTEMEIKKAEEAKKVAAEDPYARFLDPKAEEN